MTLDFTTCSKPEPNPDVHELTKFLSDLDLRHLIREHGMQRTRKFVNKQSRGNAARTFRELADFLPGNGGDFPIPDCVPGIWNADSIRKCGEVLIWGSVNH